MDISACVWLYVCVRMHQFLLVHVHVFVFESGSRCSVCVCECVCTYKENAQRGIGSSSICEAGLALKFGFLGNL